MQHHSVTLDKSLAVAATLCALLGTNALAMQQTQARKPGEETILFVTRVGGDPREPISRICVMNPDGSRQVPLPGSDSSELNPVRSPDGKLIAFTAVTHKVEQGTETRGADIFVMNADGSARKRLTFSPADTGAMTPGWSPDSKRIVYIRVKFIPDKLVGSYQRAEICVMDSDGKNQKARGNGMMPAWSPDGKKILFSAFQTQNEEQSEVALHVMDADGGNITRLRKNAMAGEWSPDGRRIAYIGFSQDKTSDIPGHVFVMNADGSQPKQLTRTKEAEVGVQWSADGKRLMFTRQFPDDSSDLQKAQIFSMDADGKDMQQLTTVRDWNVIGMGTFTYLPNLR